MVLVWSLSDVLAAAARKCAPSARSAVNYRVNDEDHSVSNNVGSSNVNMATTPELKLDDLDEIFECIQPLHVLSGHMSEVLALVACEQSPLVLSGSSDCTVKVRDVKRICCPPPSHSPKYMPPNPTYLPNLCLGLGRGRYVLSAHVAWP